MKRLLLALLLASTLAVPSYAAPRRDPNLVGAHQITRVEPVRQAPVAVSARSAPATPEYWSLGLDLWLLKMFYRVWIDLNMPSTQAALNDPCVCPSCVCP